MVSLEQEEGAATADAGVAFVDAPTALAGFQLTIRLASSDVQNEQAGAGRWLVHVPVTGPRAVQGLLAQVRRWLRGEQMAETRVRVGGDVYRVAGARSADREEIDGR